MRSVWKRKLLSLDVVWNESTDLHCGLASLTLYSLPPAITLRKHTFLQAVSCLCGQYDSLMNNGFLPKHLVYLVFVTETQFVLCEEETKNTE